MSQRSLPSVRGLRTAAVGIVVLMAGAVLMATEVLAFRVVGRTFGTALRETSAVIAVFLAAMSIGYALGGAVGDRRPRLGTLVAPLLVAGLWLVAVPFVDRPVSEAIAISDLPLATHALVVTGVLFALPSGLLAAVSPIVIRLATRGLERAGRVAGSVAALSAAGSIAGTLVTGFHLIGHFPISGILRGLGSTLIVMCALLLLPGLRRRLGTSGRRATPAILLLGLATQVSARVVHERDSAYHHIRVVDRGEFRHLLFDDTRQSRMLIDDPTVGGYAYTELFHLAWLFDDDIERVLFLGLGGGTGPREYLTDYPNVHVDVAEVDPAVIEVAETYFALPTGNPNLDVTPMDGRVALRRRDRPVDVIVVDAYTSGKYGSMIPFHLTTKEFFELAASRLTDDGILLYNVVQQMEERQDRFLRALVKTMRTAFAEVYLFETLESTNTVVVATRQALGLDVETLSLRAEDLIRREVVTRPDFLENVLLLYDGEIPTEDVPLLTDDYAPVDRLLRP